MQHDVENYESETVTHMQYNIFIAIYTLTNIHTLMHYACFQLDWIMCVIFGAYLLYISLAS